MVKFFFKKIAQGLGSENNLALLFLFLLIPFFLNSLHTQPFSDDYVLSRMKWEGGAFAVYSHTYNVTARYTHAIVQELLASFIDPIRFYGIGPFLMLSFLAFAVLYFFTAFQFYLGYKRSLFVAISFFFIFLSTLPLDVLLQGVYWMAAATVYSLGTALLLIALGILMRLYFFDSDKQKRNKLTYNVHVALLILCFILAAGCSEQIAGLQALLLVFLAIVQWNTEHKAMNKRLRCLLLLLTFFCMLFVFTTALLTPGAESYRSGHELGLWESLGNSFVYYAPYAFRTYMSLFLLLFTIFLFPTVSRLILELKSLLQAYGNWKLLMILFFYILLPLFPIVMLIWGLGYAGPRGLLIPHAILIFAFPFACATILLLWDRYRQNSLFSYVFKKRKRFVWLAYSFAMIACLVSYSHMEKVSRSLTSFYKSGIGYSFSSTRVMLSDALSGRAAKFDKKLKFLYEAMRQAQERGIRNAVIYNPGKLPLSMAVGGFEIIHKDPNFYNNTCMAYYFGFESLRLTDRASEANIFWSKPPLQ